MRGQKAGPQSVENSKGANGWNHPDAGGRSLLCGYIQTDSFRTGSPEKGKFTDN
jgi:hypothetical protein